jgi:hypothetical protein
MKVRGFADLIYEDSAGMSFARAVDRAATDPSLDRPAAWVIEERRISFSLEDELGAAELDSHRRVLEELAREAISGEVRLEPEGATRWELVVAPAKSTAPRGETSGVAAATSDLDLTTIPVGTRSA